MNNNCKLAGLHSLDSSTSSPTGSNTDIFAPRAKGGGSLALGRLHTHSRTLLGILVKPDQGCHILKIILHFDVLQPRY